MMSLSGKTGMETLSSRVYFIQFFNTGKAGIKGYLNFIANGNGEVHGKGNVVDSKSQASPRRNLSKSRSSPRNRGPRKQLWENNMNSRRLAKSHRALKLERNVY